MENIGGTSLDQNRSPLMTVFGFPGYGSKGSKMEGAFNVLSANSAYWGKESKIQV